jgi:hypothetical protein
LIRECRLSEFKKEEWVGEVRQQHAL